jgi:3-oxoacyl-[acyl-carrier protein] reductase
MKKNAIVVAGSRGIGKSISDSIEKLNIDVTALSKEDLDTSNIDMIKEYLKTKPEADILVLNTGGPPAKQFFNITEQDFNKYYNQLFLSFCLLLQGIKIKDDGFIFLISSYNIKEPNSKLVLSNSFRIAFSSVLKSVSKIFAQRGINCINIAPGPIKTERLFSLVDDVEAMEKKLPMGRAAEPEELGDFVGALIKHNVKYLNGVTINFDGGHSNYIL